MCYGEMGNHDICDGKSVPLIEQSSVRYSYQRTS